MVSLTLDLKLVLELHGKWLRGEAGGSRANLSRANLSGADLSRANLSRADLSWANLSGADLSGADLSWADLSGANLSRADLSGADLSGADLSWANLSGADLSWATPDGKEHKAKATGRAASGYARGYWWFCIAVEGGLVLRFGCEMRFESDWNENLSTVCERHEPGRDFESTIRAILAYVKEAWR